MILVDTNVLSEPMKPRPDPAVMTWLNFQPWDELFLCTPVLAELRYGSRPSRPSAAAGSCRRGPRRSVGAARRSRSRRGWRPAPPARLSPSSPDRGRGSRDARARPSTFIKRVAGHQRRLGAAVHEAPHPGPGAGIQARCGSRPHCRARSRPSRRSRRDAPRDGTQPRARPARRPPSSRGRRGSPRTGSAPSSETVAVEESERASARTPQPSASRRAASRPPMNPEPPVTNAVGIARS